MFSQAIKLCLRWYCSCTQQTACRGCQCTLMHQALPSAWPSTVMVCFQKSWLSVPRQSDHLLCTYYTSQPPPGLTPRGVWGGRSSRLNPTRILPCHEVKCALVVAAAPRDVLFTSLHPQQHK